MDSIKTTAGPYWITVGLDGKLAYISSGDVIDMKTRKIVGHLKDEYGRPLHSEKFLDMLFENGKLTRVVNQFGNGIGSEAPLANVYERSDQVARLAGCGCSPQRRSRSLSPALLAQNPNSESVDTGDFRADLRVLPRDFPGRGPPYRVRVA